MKKITSFLFVFACFTAISQTKFPYQNASLPTEQRVKDLLSRMTVEEKAGQLNQLNGGAFTGPAGNDAGQNEKSKAVKDGKVGSLLNVIGVADTKAIQEVAMQSKLKIPLLFGYDVIHGYKTIFPIPLAEACSWNLSGIQKNSSIAAKEASAAGIHWTFAPMCDISNDPRWGRIMEGAGEDPYLAGLVSAARVIGFQGNLNDNEHVMACVKHFAAYGAVEAGKEYNQVDLSRPLLWNKYLPSYKAAIDAGAATVMNAFNVFDGIPASANKFLVTDVLKKKWGFKGFVVSDWASFKEEITHGYAENGKDAALKSLQAGSMMDMESKVSVQYLPELVKEGKITLVQLDEAVGKILTQKFKLGLFDNPYKYCDLENEKNKIFTTENRAIAKQAAEESIVLLKNNNSILPLQKDKKVALIGLYANSKADMFDFWIGQGNSNDAVTVYEGLKNKIANITFCNGYNADNSTNETLINEAIKNANEADVILVNIGISGKMAGEDRALANPSISKGQLELLAALQKTGKPVVALVSSARPLILTEAEPFTDALVQCWILGTEHGNAISSMLLGEYNPSAKTVVTFPYAIGQIPIYYNHFNTGRPTQTDGMGNWYSRYRDVQSEPLFPFGYGLSYTNYTYGDIKLSSSEIKKTEKLICKISVTNSGKIDGEEIVQLYIRDYVASIVRPVLELKAFEKVKLKAGETKEVTFTLSQKDLSFFDGDGNTVIESGKFSVFIGANSKDLKQADFQLR
ncbi:beta-glucosidase BglX [Flavobacterium sp.]|uniref:beta-glucosidase BglX n=1 Tax=Flavobacterium sp. TaxID=239 RepID=UPI0037510AB3